MGDWAHSRGFKKYAHGGIRQHDSSLFVLLLTVHMQAPGPGNGSVAPNLVCAAQRVGTSKCEVMIFPPSGTLPHAGMTNREEEKRKTNLLNLFLSVQL